jgi:hypothetical protein
LSALTVGNPGCVFLFDDYTTRRGFAVDRLLNREVMPRLGEGGKLTVLDTLSKDRPSAGGEVEHLMALLTMDRAAPAATLFSLGEMRTFRWRRNLHETLVRLYHCVRPQLT